MITPHEFVDLGRGDEKGKGIPVTSSGDEAIRVTTD
jgi:hypothetical protein